MTETKLIVNVSDAKVSNNPMDVLATYSHFHALGTKGWACGLFKQAVLYKRKKKINREDVPLDEGKFPIALNF